MVSNETITRFLVLHILFLPIALAAFCAGRTIFVSLMEQGKERVEEGANAFETQLAKGVIVFFFTVMVIFSGALVFPLPLDGKADPTTVPELLKPEWYFLPLHQLTKYFPSWVCALAGLVVPALLALLPFVDRSHSKKPGDRKKYISIAALLLSGTLLLGIIGHLSGRERTYFGKKVRFSMDGIPMFIGEDLPVDESED